MTEQMTSTRFSAIEIADLLGRPRPTQEQIEVIEAPLAPVLVVAGAGSGKTETMSARVVYLIANGLVSPDGVLGLTFTRKAAGELSDRVRQRLRTLTARLADLDPVGAAVLAPDGQGDLLAAMQRPTISTYNSYAANLVKEHALRIGIEPGARLLGEASQWQLAHEVVEGWTGDLSTSAALSTVVGAVQAMAGTLSEHLLSEQQAREQMHAIIDAISATPPGNGRAEPYAQIRDLVKLMSERIELLDLVREYKHRKRVSESLDFGDQVAHAAHLALTFPEVAAGERERFPVVLLDEYQDTSYAQARMLGALFGVGHAVTAVGDPHQSIYGWRGASASGLSRFAEQTNNVGAVKSLSLSTSWRNDTAILDVANRVAKPLADEQVGLEVTKLGARPGAGTGLVRAGFFATLREEANAVADFIAAHWRPAARESDRVTAAVLCRARRQFIDVEIALRERGIPVEVVGLGGLLSSPEVVDLVALLQVVHDPSRGDSLMRLLTGPRMNLGAADLFAISDRMRELASRQSRHTSAPDVQNTAEPDEDTIREADIIDSHSIIDVLDELPPRGWTSRDGRALSETAQERLEALAELLADLRGRTYLSVPEFVREAEQALGLDIEISMGAMSLLETHRARANLDAFQDVAISFVDGAQVPTLGAFLAWLDAAQVEERGLDQPLADPDPNAVSIITVHAAKGLEWDVVAVPGLVDGGFPNTKANGDKDPKDNAWLRGLATVPYPLRGDARDLPVFDYADAEDHKDLEQRRVAFTEAAGQYQVTEERRLAYVAFTRARSRLLLTGSWFRTGQKPTTPSLFLTELVEAGLVPNGEWAQAPDEGVTNPALDEDEAAIWPDTGRRLPTQRIDERSAQLVRSALRDPERGAEPAADRTEAEPRAAAPEIEEAFGHSLTEIADLLLAERDLNRRPVTEVAVPAHISASALVRMAADRDAYALELRRPVPSRPSVHALRGTVFHLWVEQFYSAPSLVELDDLPGFDELEHDLDLDKLRETFEASEWAGLDPVAIEVDIETPVAGASTRSRIDAVFRDPQNPGGFVVVDWKTGREPHDQAAIRAREVQLAVYRLAWSRWKQIPLEQVSAAFFYVGSGATVRPAQLMDEHALVALIRGEDATSE